LHEGECVRAVIKISERKCNVKQVKISTSENKKTSGGYVKVIKHWSETNNCEMTFAIYLPDRKCRF